MNPLPIMTPDIPVYRDRRLSDLPASGVAVLGAQVGQAVHDLPSLEINRGVNLAESEQGTFVPDLAGGGVWVPPQSPLVSQADAQAKLKEDGLEGQIEIPEAGIRQRTLDLLMENRKGQNRRAAVLSRSPGGFGLTAGGLAATLAVSLLDPVNDAMGLMPVVGEARYARILAGAGESILGRTAVRAGVGAVEGAVGMAPLIPLHAGVSAQYQEDYGMNDALADLAFSGLFGAALHNVGPAIRGVYRLGRGVPLEHQQAALSEAISAFMEDRQPRVTEVMRSLADDEFSAYHGSPHTFDAFSLENIGTGEGAQAYGHGLYFAESRGVAEHYRSQLRQPGQKFDSAYELAAKSFIETYGDVSLADLQTAYKTAPVDELRAAIRAAKGEDAGALYKVGIKGHPDDFLDWDKPLSEQDPAIKKILADKFGVKFRDMAAEQRLIDRAIKEGKLTTQYPEYARLEAIMDSPEHRMTGGEYYSHLVEQISPEGKFREPSRQAEAERSASAALREAGIPGIRYLDQQSRDAGEGSRNFVLFSDKDIRILERNGKPLIDTLTQIRDDRLKLRPDDARLAQEIERQTPDFNRPLTPDAAEAEVTAYAAATDERIAQEAAAGRLSEADMAILNEASAGVEQAEYVGQGWKAAAACIARGTG